MYTSYRIINIKRRRRRLLSLSQCLHGVRTRHHNNEKKQKSIQISAKSRKKPYFVNTLCLLIVMTAKSWPFLN